MLLLKGTSVLEQTVIASVLLNYTDIVKLDLMSAIQTIIIITCLNVIYDKQIRASLGQSRRLTLEVMGFS